MKQVVFTLCKKVTDPEEKTEWQRVNCFACSTPLRLTLSTKEKVKGTKIKLIPICFDCSLKGPIEAMRIYVEQRRKDTNNGK